MDQNGSESRRATILVVEDAEPIRRMVAQMLMQSGYNSLEAGDGADALTVLDSHSDTVDLVLTDLLMPRMTGAELAEHLARLRPGLPILFMSGYSEDPVVMAIGRTRDNFLAKPFTASALLDKVRQALSGWQGGASEIRSGSSAP